MPQWTVQGTERASSGSEGKSAYLIICYGLDLIGMRGVDRPTRTFVKLDAQFIFDEDLLRKIVLMELWMYNVSEG
jgi:hypothetical protein